MAAQRPRNDHIATADYILYGHANRDVVGNDHAVGRIPTVVGKGQAVGNGCTRSSHSGSDRFIQNQVRVDVGYIDRHRSRAGQCSIVGNYGQNILLAAFIIQVTVVGDANLPTAANGKDVIAVATADAESEAVAIGIRTAHRAHTGSVGCAFGYAKGGRGSHRSHIVDRQPRLGLIVGEDIALNRSGGNDGRVGEDTGR